MAKAPTINYTLKDMAGYIESHEPGVMIINARLYAGREIMEGDNGKLYILRALAGWDTFTTMPAAMDAIRAKPMQYPVVKTTKDWAAEAAKLAGYA